MESPPPDAQSPSTDGSENKLAIPDDLRNTARDYVIVFGRMVAGAVPYAGGAISEMLGFIPKQRHERVVEFLAALAQKMESLDRKFNIQNAMTVDLVETTVRQAARAIRQDRNQFLVNFLKECADVSSSQYELDKKILHVLEELTDKDIEVLKAHASFQTRFRLEQQWPRPRPATEAEWKKMTPQERYEVEASRVSLEIHRDTLLRYELIRREEPTSHIADIGGMLTIQQERPPNEHRITTFGRLVLHRIFDEYFE